MLTIYTCKNSFILIDLMNPIPVNKTCLFPVLKRQSNIAMFILKNKKDYSVYS